MLSTVNAFEVDALFFFKELDNLNKNSTDLLNDHVCNFYNLKFSIIIISYWYAEYLGKITILRSKIQIS
jgi:hypothetical protein